MTVEITDMLISAQVVLYPQDRISEMEAQQCERFFREEGFELGNRFADSFAITASVAKFERIFGCHIVSDEYGVHCDSGADPIDYELPLAQLYVELRDYIKVVTFTAPPDFGPDNF